MQAVILAGGLATRLGQLTQNVPKSMVKISDRPFLEYQLEFLKQNAVDQVVLCVGHLGNQIEDYFGNGAKFGVKIKYSYERSKLLGTGGALKNAGPMLEDVFFTLYGDSYLSLDFSTVMSYFRKFDKLALMTVYKNYDRYDGSNVAIEGNMVRHYGISGTAEKLVYIDYGASLFRKKTLDLFPSGEVFAIGDIFTKLIAMDQLLAYEAERRFYQIGTPEGLQEFIELVKGMEKG